MKRFVDINGIDNNSTTNWLGNKEHRADYNKIIGVLVCPIGAINYSLSINDSDVIIGSSIEYKSKIAPDKRILFINRRVKRDDLIRISFRQSDGIDGSDVIAKGKIYLFVEE